ncbi:furin-like protease kpc-1 [Mizuhopecten yessoensis]|uniref:furin-like protease kpc-1 n=1 Tax=Mizuhopecten yessoensis TaxID=6573 RepID=UPI000B45EB8F|nr:furin-like protease kpc-1 [Mizuhopecten yessoensis]
MNDPLWNKQWYLNDVRAIPSMNIQKAWAKGFTGKGVVIGIVDGGVDVTHPDLSNKVKRSLSYDFIENDNDPSPAYRESHGTKCAGIVVAARNNRNCIVGASFGSTFANLRISDNFGSTPVTESRALVHKYDEIHIYSNSWGVIEGLGFEQQPPVVENAISAAVQKGRNGLGSIFLWASGNGGTNDNCNCDGYAKSINVISIASVSENQYAGYYSEYCSAILASCYSGDDVQYDILTTDIGGSCTNFSGTSASTPLSAAVIALVLEANPNLTYRDIQHLIVSTSKQHSLQGRTWKRNGGGYMYNDLFGFGLLDANALTDKAITWKLVPFQHKCVSDIMTVERSSNVSVTSFITSNNCNDTHIFHEVNFLEHVEIEVSFSATKHGAVELDLTSPSGTTSHMLTLRQRDVHRGAKTWRFMSVHFWGENPTGQWTLKMATPVYSQSGSLHKWNLILYGTKYNPAFGRQPDDEQIPKESTKSITTKEEDNFCDSENATTCGLVIGGSILGVVSLASGVIIAFKKMKKRNSTEDSNNAINGEFPN